MTPAAHDPLLHLFCLCLQSVLPQGTSSNANQVEDIAVLANEQAPQKPDCQLIGEDGNIFNLIGLASRTLRENGLEAQAKEMQERIMGGGCHDYSAALNVIGEYVNITGPEESGMEMGGM